jgi:Na+-driven multidrug efflux pump
MPTLRPDKSDWKIDRRIIKQQLRLGIPMAIQYSITASGTMIMQSAFNTFDSIAVGAITAASKFQGIITQGMFTVGQTMAAYAGQNYGARNMLRIRQGVKAALKIFIVYSLAAAVFAVVAVPHVLWIFFDADVDVSVYIPWANIYIIESAVCYFFLAMIFIYRHTIQSIGYAGMTMVLGLVELVARIILSIYAINVQNYYIAVASDPFAWITAGFCGMFIALALFRKIEKRWADEDAGCNSVLQNPES